MRSRVLLLIGAAIAALVVSGWASPRVGVPFRFWLSAVRTVTVGDRDLRLVEVTYAQGLRGVEALGSLDGALFVLHAPAGANAGMGMDDVLMPLDVVFFDASGRVVGRATMARCQVGNCRGYFPTAPWQFAIEAPAGSLSWVTDKSGLSL